MDPPAHHVPSSADYLTAVTLGFGWGMVPELQHNELRDVDLGAFVDVELYWQHWKLASASLDQVTDAVLTAARTQLRGAPGPLSRGPRRALSSP